MSQPKYKVSELSAFSIMDASPECVKLVDADGLIEYINQAGLDFIEAPGRESVIGASVYDFIHKDYITTWKENHATVCSGKAMVWQYEVIGQKGTKRFLETHATPIFLPDGNRLQLAVTKDITESILIERTARETKNKVKVMAEAVLAISAQTDLTSLLSEINTRARQIIGTHLSVTTMMNGPELSNAINVFSFSPKYQDFDTQAKEAGLFSLAGKVNGPVRFTQEELANHLDWIDYSGKTDHQAIFHGWLAVPLKRNNLANLGLIQLSNKVDGEFTSLDENLLIQFAEYASMAIERHLSLVELQKNEQRFRTITNSIPTIAWMAHADGYILV